MRPHAKTTILSLLVVALFLQAAPAGAQRRAAATNRTEAAVNNSNATARALQKFLDDEWEWTMRENPTFASTLGDRRYNDRWEDAGLEHIARQHQHELDTLKRLESIPRAQLPAADQLNYDLFKKDLDNDIEGYKFKLYLLPVNQRGGIQTVDELAELLRFQTVKDYDDWIARMKALPVYMDQTIALMREGVKEKMLWPKVVEQRVAAQIDKQTPARAEDSTFYKPFKQFPDDIPTADRERLAQSARDAITESVIPSYKKLKDYFTKEYLPASFDRVGVCQWPNGAQLYAVLAPRYSTTEMPPDQLHQNGLQ